MPNLFDITAEDINQLFGLRKRPEIEGNNLYSGSLLFSCGLEKVEKNCVQIKASCIQSSHITEQPHTIGVVISYKGNKKNIKCTCSCKAGAGKSCKHIFATLVHIQRLCVISTNIAETSLTIPNIKYVVDCGKTKIKLYDKITGVSCYIITWISKSSADQRAGRAGRLGPGHCYRLYSSAIYNDIFKKYSIPEIQQKPIDDLYLKMRCMNIEKILNFPFPTAPDLLQLKTSEKRLKILGILNDNNDVTPLGKTINKFPVLPRFGKMLALSHQFNLLPFTICLIAALSVQEVLLETPIDGVSDGDGGGGGGSNFECRKKWRLLRKQWAGTGHSLLLGDNMVLLRAIGAAEYSDNIEEFCKKYGLRYKAILEIRKLRIQLINEIKLNIKNIDDNLIFNLKLLPPNELQAKLLRQILLSGMGDQIAHKIPLDDVNNDNKSKFKYAYYANNIVEPVFLHSSSVLKESIPEFIIFNEIYEINNKMYIRGITAIEPEWLPIYIPNLCNLDPPLNEPPPYFNKIDGKIHCTCIGTFGNQAWQLPKLDIEYPQTIDCYKWFIKYFLDGEIFEKLKKYKNLLLSSSELILKPWAKLQIRTEIFLKKLMEKNCFNRNKLLEIWYENDKKFLLNEYLMWLPESAKSEVTLLWPPI